AQVEVARASFEQARSLNQSGVVAGIDVLRAQVELQSEQNVLISARNDLDRSRLDVLRAIGLSPGQQIRLTDQIPFAPPPSLTQADAISSALMQRPDLQSALAMEASAARQKSAAEGERYPSAGVNANYGLLGRSPSNSHGTYAASVAVDLPIFE